MSKEEVYVITLVLNSILTLLLYVNVKGLEYDIEKIKRDMEWSKNEDNRFIK